MKLKGLFLAAAMTAISSVSFAGGISQGELSATTCFSCHGPEGKYVGGSIPPLAGYPAAVMSQQLIAMKDGTRPTTLMIRHVKGYSDDELKAIAEYFGTLKP